MRYFNVIILCLLIVSLSHAQEGKDRINAKTCLQYLRTYNLDAIPKQIRKIEDRELAAAFQFQYEFLTRGTINDSLSIDLTNIKNDNFKETITFFTYADYLNFRKQDSLSFQYYRKAYASAKKSKDEILLGETLVRINNYLRKNNTRNLEMFHFYKEAYKTVVKDSIGRFWSFYYDQIYKFQERDRNNEKLSKKDITALMQGETILPDINFLKGKYYQLKGIVSSHFQEDYESAKKNYGYAIENYAKINYEYATKDHYSCLYNQAIANVKLQHYHLAIQQFLSLKKSDQYTKNSYIELNSNDWLYQSYKGLKQYDSAIFYQSELARIKEKQEQLKTAIAIKEIDEKFKVNEKEEQITELEGTNKDLEQKVYTLLPILGGVLLILAVIFFLYKRYKKKSVVLEEEKSETLQKLDELKEVVIKNHIVLKDKTKVYIADLLYVKADDHYLHIFTSEGKNHFVRGKLSQIKQELPPNFIQCHRSYIVNTNFIKRINKESLTLISKDTIPLSRSFKKNF